MTIRNTWPSFLLAGLLGCSGVWAATPVSSADNEAQHFQWLDQYCGKCHNANDWAGGLAFDTMSPQAIGSDAKVWEEAVVKLRGRLMPPIGEKQPQQADINQFVGWMEGRLDAHAAANPDPGRVGLHRLNRNEYARVVEALLGLRVNPELLLPKDTKSEGFDFGDGQAGDGRCPFRPAHGQMRLQFGGQIGVSLHVSTVGVTVAEGDMHNSAG